MLWHYHLELVNNTRMLIDIDQKSPIMYLAWGGIK